MKNIYTLFFMNFRRLLWGMFFLFAGMVSAMADTWDGVTYTAPSYSNGTYTVTKAANLAWIAQQTNNGTSNHSSRYFNGQTIVLAANIDVGGLSNISWPMIGNSSSRTFEGTFNGNGYTISNVYHNSSNANTYVGLFGYVSNGAIIENVTVNGINLTEVSNVGGLIGEADGSSNTITISGCNVSGTITSSGYNTAGGIVALAYGEVNVSTCVSSVTVTAVQQAGGLIGYMQNDGNSNTATISGSSASGVITGTSGSSSYYIGGLIGRVANPAMISSCSATGNVTGISYVASFIGSVEATANITGSNASGNLTNATGSYLGGFIGYLNSASTISSCYSTGSLNATGYYIGGFVGLINVAASITSCYSTSSVAGGSTPVGGFAGAIASAATLSGCYATGNLNCTNTNTAGFAGTISANASITNCYATGIVYTTSNPSGGFVATVGNCTSLMSGCYATGNVTSNSAGGGFIGVLNSNLPIANCYATGNVTGKNGLGGFIGTSTSTSYIVNSFAIGMVEGSGTLGGFMGSCGSGKVVNCYATGAVITTNTQNPLGGFIGSAAGTFANCYATGIVYGNSSTWAYGGFAGNGNSATFTKCYFDTQGTGTTQASGQGNSSGITGVTTANMITASGPGLTNGSPYGSSSKVWSFSAGYYPQLYNFKNGNSSGYSITSPSSISVPVFTTSAAVQAWSALSVVPLNLATADASDNVNSDFNAPMATTILGSALQWAGVYQSTDAGRLTFTNDSIGDLWLAQTGTATFTATDANGYDKTFFINILSMPAPSITVTPTSATFLGLVNNTSASQSFSVTGKRLSASIIITAPAYYQLSTDNATWSASAGNVTMGTSVGKIYVRYVPTTVESMVAKTITIASTGVTTQNITVTGTAYNGAVYVRKGGYGNQDGTSWANAAATVQQGVETSNGLSVQLPVYVAAGDYYEDPNYTTGDYAVYTSSTSQYWQGWANTFVMRNGVNVYGSFPEFGTTNNNNADTTMRVPLSTLSLYKTTLHGSTNYRVLGPVYSLTPLAGSTGFTTSTVWDGFDLTGADMETNAGGGDDLCGAGVFTITNSILRNCLIEHNFTARTTSTTNDGAGAEMYGGTLRNCIIHHNTSGTSPTNSAGTINIHAGGSNVINCLIYANYASYGGGGISINSTTYNTSTSSYIINNTIANNTCTNNSSGIQIFSGSSFYFYNNAIWNNTVSEVTAANEKNNAWPNGYSSTLGTGSLLLSATNASGTNPPYFVKPDTTITADYRLASTSSALYNKGSYSVSTLVPTIDIRGVFRNVIPDLGCYELASRLYYVNNATGTDATGYGLNWSTPYKTLQYAINQYNQYDYPQVWVAKGNASYTPTAGTPFYQKQNMAIYGGFAGNQATEFPTTSAMATTLLNSRNIKINQTVLAGNGTSVVGTASGDTNWSGAILDGFTITGATGGSTLFAGVIPASATIQNCKIINNATSGLQLASGANAYNVLVANNTGDGVNMAGTANLVNGTIANNTGVGINSSTTTATVTNSILWGNSANVNASGSVPVITYSASAAAAAYNSTSNTVTVNNSWSGNTGNIELYQRSPNFKTKSNYELLLISPCLSKGLATANTLAIDANGKPRTYSSTIDMGAFEKWDGTTVDGTTPTIKNVRQGWSIPLTNLTISNDTTEVMVTAGTTFNMSNNTTLKTRWLELLQDTLSTHLPAQLTNGTITSDSVLYVRRFSKTLSGTNGTWGVWSFFGMPFNTAPLSALDGATVENTVRIETYSENARALNGVGYAWPAGRLSAASTVKQGTGYALSFNSKVPQNDIGQTVIFSSQALSPVTFTETGTPTANVTLGETSSTTTGVKHWYDCGWNLIANPLPQTAGINTMWTSSSSNYYGAAYFYKPYTDSYNVVPATALKTGTGGNAIAPNAAFFVQTDVNGAAAAFTAGTGSVSPVLQSMAYVRPSTGTTASSDASTASAEPPATFEFNVKGVGDDCNTYVIFDSHAHADMEPMEDNPTMVGVTAKPALQLSTTAEGSDSTLAINRLPFAATTMTVPMQVYVPVAGSYTITMPQSDTIAGLVLLKDENGGLHDLTTGDYTFTTTTDKVTNNYMIIFSSNVASQVAKGVTIVQDQRNVIVLSTSIMQQVALYGESGQTFYAQTPLSTQVTLQLPPTPGIYLIKVVTTDGVITKKLVNRQ